MSSFMTFQHGWLGLEIANVKHSNTLTKKMSSVVLRFYSKCSQEGLI